MNNLFLASCFACLFGATVLQAQAPKFEWVRPGVSNFAADDPGIDVYDFRTDKAGNSYFYGNLYGEKIDLGAGVKLTNTRESGTIFLFKIKPNGTAEWIRAILTSEDLDGFAFGNYAPGLAVDDNGNAFISGTIESDSIYFGNNLIYTRICEDCSHAFVARFDSDGLAQWVSVIAGSEDADQRAGKLALSGSSLYFTGKCEGQVVDFGGGLSFTDLQSNGFFLEKLDVADGKGEWVRFLNPESEYSLGYQVKVAPTGEVWVTGEYSGSPIDFGNNIRLDIFEEEFQNNYFLAKYSSTGTPLAAINVNSTDYVSVLDIAVDPQFGGVYLACDYTDTLRTGNIALATTDEGAYSSNLLYYINNTVASVLDVPYDGEGYGISAVVSAPDGDYYISGFFEDDELQLGDTLISNQGCFDSYLMRGNLSEGRIWARGVGGAGCEGIVSPYSGQAMDLDAKGNLYVSGIYILGMQIDGNVKLGSGLLVGKIKSETVATHDPAAAPVDFTITPNPTSGTFQVNLGEMSSDNGWLVIHDMQGREIYTQTVSTSPVEVNQALATGTYTVSFFTENQVVRKKLVVQAGE